MNVWMILKLYVNRIYFFVLNIKIIDNKTGYILDNEKEFADAIVRLLENDSLWKEMHLNCLKYQRNWGWRGSRLAQTKRITPCQEHDRDCESK